MAEIMVDDAIWKSLEDQPPRQQYLGSRRAVNAGDRNTSAYVTFGREAR